MSFKINARYALPVLLIFVFIIYLPGLNGPFLLDDYSNFVNIQTTDADWETLKSAAIGDGTTRPYRPLSRTTLLLNNYLSGTENAYYHKLTNLLIHLLTGVVVYLFCCLCFRAVDYRRSSIALLVTAVWLLHPLQVSTVMYAVQRMAQLSSLFTLLALLVYLHARLEDKKGNSLTLVQPVIGISIFSILALMSKESAALIPLYILAIEYLLFRFKTRNTHNRLRLWMLQLLFVFLPLIVGLIYFTGQYEQILNYDSRNFTLIERLMTQSVAVIFYLGQIVLPNLSTMGLFHDDFIVYRSLDLIVIFSILSLVALAVLAISTRNKYPLVAFGISWFFLSHLLESTALPLEMVYEHRNYLALFGPVLSIVAGFMLFVDRVHLSRTITGIIYFSILLVFSLQTFYRTISWSSEENFAATHLINHPESERTHNLLAQIAFKQGKRELALSELEQVSRINPEDTSYHVLYVLAWCQDTVSKKQIEDAIKAAETIQHRKSARSVLYAVRKIEYLHANDQCQAVSSENLLRLTTSMIINPIIRNEALKYHLHARALAANNQLNEAKTFYLKSWQAKQQNLHPVFELIQLLRENMRLDESCKVIEELLRSPISYDNGNTAKIDSLYASCQETD
ncbi:MAG: hypothetical protein ACN4GR_05975 [Arenicellales bacterium]